MFAIFLSGIEYGKSCQYGKICHIKIAQFRYIKIQLETKDISTRLRGMI